MPTPNEDETRDEFVKRCIPVVLDDGTAKDDDQAIAVCNSMWEEEREKAAGKDKQNRAREAQRARADKYGISPKQGKPVSKPGEYANVAESDFGDPVNWSYPADAEHAKPALGYFNQSGQREKGGYSTNEWGIIGKRLAERIGRHLSAKYEYVQGKLRQVKEKTANPLKSISSTDDELIAANYIILFGDENNRDLEGIASPHKNADGTLGEFFTSSTVLDSPYTKTGHLLVDWEHGAEPDGDVAQPGEDDVLGYVRWKSARVDDRGVWVERVLNRHNEYMKFLETLIEQEIIGTSSEAVGDKVKVKANGEITDWPLKRDTLTVMPMEWRQKWNNQNVLQAVKGLAELDDAFKSLLPEQDEPPEQEPSEGDAGASREVELRAKSGQADAEMLLIQIETMRR